MEITSERDRWNHLQVSTKVDLGNRQQLRIETYKGDGRNIRCTASVVTLNETGYQHVFGSKSRGDWRMTLAVKPGRATEKTLRELHADSIEQAGGLDAIVEIARAYYAAQALAQAS